MSTMIAHPSYPQLISLAIATRRSLQHHIYAKAGSWLTLRTCAIEYCSTAWDGYIGMYLATGSGALIHAHNILQELPTIMGCSYCILHVSYHGRFLRPR